MSAIFTAFLQLFLAAFGQGLQDWLRVNESEADAQSVGRLTAALAGADAEIGMLTDGSRIDTAAAAMSDDEARAEALKWTR